MVIQNLHQISAFLLLHIIAALGKTTIAKPRGTIRKFHRLIVCADVTEHVPECAMKLQICSEIKPPSLNWCHDASCSGLRQH